MVKSALWLSLLLCDVVAPVVTSFHPDIRTYPLAVQYLPTKYAYGAMLIIVLIVIVRHDSHFMHHAHIQCATFAFSPLC